MEKNIEKNNALISKYMGEKNGQIRILLAIEVNNIILHYIIIIIIITMLIILPLMRTNL